MVLGLQAPAFAAPTVTSFTPTTGPTDCVVALTGTGLLDVPKVDQDVVFVHPSGVPADNIVLDGAGATGALFARISSTEMWVQIPATLGLGIGYKIRVDGGGGGTASATTFTRVDGAGGCAPTITSVTPNCGSTDTVVNIKGTNLIGPAFGPTQVRFAPYTVDAAHSVPDVDVTTSLSVVVPSVSANAIVDGLVRVTTFTSVSGGVAFSPAPPFDISDACTPETGDEHARSITFKIKKSGAASGVVSSTEDPAFDDCAAAVPVKIQRKTSGGWKTVGKATTSDTGSYSKKVKNKPGKQKFRALAPKVSLGDPVTDTCLKAKSATRSA